MSTQTYLFKVTVLGEFAGVVEAEHHDGAVSQVFRDWLVMESQEVRVARFMVVDPSKPIRRRIPFRWPGKSPERP